MAVINTKEMMAIMRENIYRDIAENPDGPWSRLINGMATALAATLDIEDDKEREIAQRRLLGCFAAGVHNAASVSINGRAAVIIDPDDLIGEDAK